MRTVRVLGATITCVNEGVYKSSNLTLFLFRKPSSGIDTCMRLPANTETHIRKVNSHPVAHWFRQNAVLAVHSMGELVASTDLRALKYCELITMACFEKFFFLQSMATLTRQHNKCG